MCECECGNVKRGIQVSGDVIIWGKSLVTGEAKVYRSEGTVITSDSAKVTYGFD